MTTRTVDKQGRLVLGARFANKLVIVDDSDESRIVIIPAKAVPEHEAWLYNNPAALENALIGIDEARKGLVAKQAPNIDAAWIDELEE